MAVTIGQSVRMYHLQLHRLIRCEAGARDHGRVTGLVIALVGGYRSYSGESRGLHVAGRVAANGREQLRQQADSEKDELYKQIGQLKVELDFLKKRAGLLD